MAETLRLDPIRCDGFGMCAELLPELISLDDWGYAVIKPGPVPFHLLGHARRAVDVCPVLALRLRPVPAEHRPVATPTPAGAAAR